MVTVSVVIPTYDDAESLPDSIDSVLDQTLSDLELLIVDDCSEDDTPRVVREYTDPRITYVRHGENSGGSAARNTGIRLSEGEYIAFLDSDDTWHPTKLEKQVSCLESRSDDWIAVYCDAEYESEGVIDRLVELYKDLSGVGRGYEGSDELIERLLMGRAFVAAGSSLLAESEYVERIGGFDERFVRHQDWEFMLRLLEHGKCAYVDEKLITINRSGTTDPDKRLAAKRMYLEEFADLIERHPASAEEIESRHMYLTAVLYLEHGRFRRGFELLPERRYLSGLNYVNVLLSSWQGVLNRAGRVGR
jgi:glycosyltransferase involved in cell wall biosynthesis